MIFQVAPQLYSRSSVDPVPDTLLLRKSDSVWNRTSVHVRRYISEAGSIHNDRCENLAHLFV
jgi:hypothetical protein